MEQESKEIEYEFEDLRRNEDPLPPSVATHFDTDDEGDKGGTGDEDDSGDDAMISKKDVDRRIAKIRRENDRKIEAAKSEAGDELVKMQGRLAKMEETDAINDLEDEHATTVERINKGIEEAMEAGDSAAVTKLTTELAEATATSVTKREALKRDADEHDEPDDLDKPQERSVIPRAKDWLAEQDWWDDPDNAHIKRFVNRLDTNLQEKGYSPHDDDFYEQLEEAIEKKYPGVITQTVGFEDDEDEDEPEDEFDNIPSKRGANKKRQRRAARRQPVGGKDAAGGGGKPPRNRGKGKTLNRDQIANMRMFGMDPEKKEHVEAYLAEVQ